MPSGLSMRNRDAVNEILSKRYLTHAKAQLSSDLVNARAEQKDPDAFNKAASTLLSTRVEEMKASGGDVVASQFSDIGTLLIAEHYADAKAKKAEQFELASQSAYDNDITSRTNKVVAQATAGASLDAIAIEAQNIISELTPSADGEINVATANGMTARRQRELIDSLNQKLTSAFVISKIKDASSEDMNKVAIDLQTGQASETTLGLIPEFYELYNQLLSNPSNLEYVIRNVSKLKGTVSSDEIARAKQTEHANDFTTGTNGQKRVSSNLTGMGINGTGQLLAAVQNPESREDVMSYLQQEVALPHYFVSALDAIASGNNIVDPSLAANMAQIAKELIRNSAGTLVNDGKGLNKKTVAFIDALSSYREWDGDANLATWIEQSRKAGLDTPDNRQIMGNTLDVENYQNQTVTEIGSNWLHNNTDFPGSFIEENAALFAYQVSITGDAGKAEDSLQELYDRQYATYKYDYKSPIGDGKQKFGVAFYYDDEKLIQEGFNKDYLVPTEEKNKSSGLYKFEETARKLVMSNPDYSVYEIGTDYLFKADPRNNADNGKFYITDRLGNFLVGSDLKPLVIYTSGIDAQTILERRRVAEERELERLKQTDFRIQYLRERPRFRETAEDIEKDALLRQRFQQP
jgi:hypothetical protein